MAAILDLVNFHRFEELEKNAIPFFSHHYYVPRGNKQIPLRSMKEEILSGFANTHLGDGSGGRQRPWKLRGFNFF